MSCLLYNRGTGKVVLGGTRFDVAAQIVTIDEKRRCAIVDGTHDTVTIGPDYSDRDEFIRQVYDRGLVMLGRRGWTLFRSEELL